MFNTLPSLNALKMFEAASRLKSFKLAASELNVSPTAVSHQVKNLEDALKVKLFVRHTRSISLTPEGERLARDVHNSLRIVLQSVNALSDTSNVLHIGTTNSFAAMWLVPRLEDFKRQHKNIEIQLNADDRLTDPSSDLRLDMTIRYGEFKEQDAAKMLINENLGCFATPDYWQRFNKKGRGVFLCTSWKNKSLPQQNFKQLISDFDSSGGSQEIQYFSDENQILQAALAGKGIAIMSELLVEIPLSNGWLTQDLRRLSDTISGFDYYCVIPKRNQRNQNVTRFVSWLGSQMTNEGNTATQVPH